jgi:hypothetical protein
MPGKNAKSGKEGLGGSQNRNDDERGQRDPQPGDQQTQSGKQNPEGNEGKNTRNVSPGDTGRERSGVKKGKDR